MAMSAFNWLGLPDTVSESIRRLTTREHVFAIKAAFVRDTCRHGKSSPPATSPYLLCVYFGVHDPLGRKQVGSLTDDGYDWGMVPTFYANTLV